MTRARAWAIAGLMVALLAGVAVALLQAKGMITDPGKLVCDIAVRRGSCD
jgi:flagellar biosynthesis protein FliQ